MYHMAVIKLLLYVISTVRISIAVETSYILYLLLGFYLFYRYVHIDSLMSHVSVDVKVFNI